MFSGTISMWMLITSLLALSVPAALAQEIVVTGEKTVHLVVSGDNPRTLAEFVKALKGNSALTKVRAERDSMSVGTVAVMFTIKKGYSLNLVTVEEAARAKGLTVVQEAEVIHEMAPGEHEMRPRQPCAGGMRH